MEYLITLLTKGISQHISLSLFLVVRNGMNFQSLTDTHTSMLISPSIYKYIYAHIFKHTHTHTHVHGHVHVPGMQF